MNTSAWRQQEAAENQGLAKMLAKLLRAAEFRPTMQQPVQILALACGECREAETLVKVVSALPNASGVVPVRLLGTDLRGREVEDAARRFRSRAGVQFEFLVEDASKLDRNREIGGGYDLAFLRHQNFWDDPKVWERIFAQGLAKLSDDGVLVITSYFDREHELAQQAIVAAGGELMVTERNLKSIELAYPGKSVDRHVAVFRKKR